MRKQTAVEWLVNELNQKIDFIPMDKWDMIRDIVQQAKEMEKQQISEAYRTGVEEDVYSNPLRTGEMYYNETYDK
jgi:hypothetical protein